MLHKNVFAVLMDECGLIVYNENELGIALVYPQGIPGSIISNNQSYNND